MRRLRIGLLVLGMLVSLALVPFGSAADPCRLETPHEARRVRSLVVPEARVVRYCWYCEGAEPVPLRVQQVELRRTEPTSVEVTGWADSPPSRRRFPLEALVRAERDASGPLAAFIRQDVERRNADTTGYLGPNDPYLVEEKRAQFAMELSHVREDHDMRSWDELYVNGRADDPRLLYVAAGGHSYRSVGHAVGCSMDGAPQSVRFVPLARDPAKAAPPTPFVADVTGQCYDGACPRDVWRVIRGVEIFDRPGSAAQPVANLAEDEVVVPTRTEAHVIGSRAVVTRDHDRFLKDDLLFVLDSQAEGFYRVWHYGELRVIDATGIDLGRGWETCHDDEQGCWARGPAPPKEIWWARVRHADGREGWVRDPLHALDGVLRSD